jgi:hypothetical protein
MCVCVASRCIACFRGIGVSSASILSSGHFYEKLIMQFSAVLGYISLSNMAGVAAMDEGVTVEAPTAAITTGNTLSEAGNGVAAAIAPSAPLSRPASVENCDIRGQASIPPTAPLPSAELPASTDSGEDGSNPPKARRGRPPGTKNKPKPDANAGDKILRFLVTNTLLACRNAKLTFAHTIAHNATSNTTVVIKHYCSHWQACM